MLVQIGGVFPQVVRTHQSGVASGITAAQIAFFQHGDFADVVVFGQVIRGCQAMTAAANDDDIVLRLQGGHAPCLRPILIVTQAIFKQ